MPFSLRSATILLAIATSACVSVNADFTRPDKTSLAIGQSAEQDVIAAEGAPQSQTVSTVRARFADRPAFDWAPGGARHYDVLHYSYGQSVLGGPPFSRQANFLLADGRLAGWDYLSDDPAQSSDFNVAAAQRLLGSGKPTSAELAGLIGPPTGRRVYPLTSAPAVRQLDWDYVGLDKASGKRVTKTLSVLVGPDDRVMTFHISEADTPLPVARTTVVPIIIAR